jgi:hypothetical protein
MSKHLGLAAAIPAFFTAGIALHQIAQNQFRKNELAQFGCMTLGFGALLMSHTKTIPEFLAYSAINLAVAAVSSASPKDDVLCGMLFCSVVPFASKQLAQYVAHGMER